MSMSPVLTEPASPGSAARTPHDAMRRRYALLGNPNTGKTTLFNRLCALRARTANFPGTTVETRIGRCRAHGQTIDVIDLPGVYSLHLDLPESRVCKQYLQEERTAERNGADRADAVVIVTDATNLARNLLFVAQVLHEGVPAVVALNMTDLAQRRGLTIDAERLSRHLGCPVVSICARSGHGIQDLLAALPEAAVGGTGVPDPADIQASVAWADAVVQHSVGGASAVGAEEDSLTDRLDAAFTHPVFGVVIFAAVMVGLFYTIFSLAQLPMNLIDFVFGTLGGSLAGLIPPGAIHDLVANGIVGGIAGTIVFLPQICLLFFLLTLLEDTGYLARAAFVMDRLLRRFGLPGHSFVPLLSAHACAIPAIMSARMIPDRRDRLATILVAPFMSCSARLPVYVLLIGILFGDQPLYAGLAFTACYAIGVIAGLLTALVVRRSLLRGPSQPMVLELPSYKIPSLRTALLTTLDRAWVFLRKAGTVILAICVLLWWLSAYPKVDPPAQVVQLRAQAQTMRADQPVLAASLTTQADRLESSYAAEHSLLGRMGRFAQPVFAPLGYDWQLTIGVLSSFAAREVFVSTMAVVVSAGDDADDPEVIGRIRSAKRSDGRAVFTPRTSASLLIFYVLAMQCLPTLVVTRRATGQWRWALLQLVYMSALAYLAAWITYTVVGAMGVT